MKLYLHQKQIENRIHELAQEVNDAHYLDDSPFVMVGILNGGFMVFTEFVKHLNIPIECDFVRVKSYTGKKQGKIKITKDLFEELCNQFVHLKDFLDKAVTLYTAESEKYYAKYSNIKKQRIISNLIDL
jgi:hypoxanthine phosphoribosyltransferase